MTRGARALASSTPCWPRCRRRRTLEAHRAAADDPLAADRRARPGAAVLGLGGVRRRRCVLRPEPCWSVLGAPFVVLCRRPGSRGRPRGARTVAARLDHRRAARGAGHHARGCDVDDADGRRARHPGRRRRAAHVAPRPTDGTVGAPRSTDGTADHRGQPASLGPPAVGRGAGRADQRRGPATAGVRCSCPRRSCGAAHDRRRTTPAAEAPQPIGLVGAHRSRRPGSGTRVRGHPAVPAPATGCAGSTGGSRCAPASCTSIDHPGRGGRRGPAASSTRWRDHGVSGGVDGAASSLDLTVRAAARARRAPRPRRRPGRAARGRAPTARGCRLRRRDRATCGGSSARSPGSAPARRSDARRSGSTSGTEPAAWSRAVADAVRRRWSPRRPASSAAGLPVVVVDTLPRDASPPSPTVRTGSRCRASPGGCRRSSATTVLRRPRRRSVPGGAVARTGHPRRRAAPAAAPRARCRRVACVMRLLRPGGSALVVVLRALLLVLPCCRAGAGPAGGAARRWFVGGRAGARGVPGRRAPGPPPSGSGARARVPAGGRLHDGVDWRAAGRRGVLLAHRARRRHRWCPTARRRSRSTRAWSRLWLGRGAAGAGPAPLVYAGWPSAARRPRLSRRGMWLLGLGGAVGLMVVAARLVRPRGA